MKIENSVKKENYLSANGHKKLGKIKVESQPKDTGKELNQMEVEYQQQNYGKETFEKENSEMKLESEQRNSQKERLTHKQVTYSTFEEVQLFIFKLVTFLVFCYV